MNIYINVERAIVSAVVLVIGVILLNLSDFFAFVFLALYASEFVGSWLEPGEPFKDKCEHCRKLANRKGE